MSIFINICFVLCLKHQHETGIDTIVCGSGPYLPQLSSRREACGHGAIQARAEGPLRKTLVILTKDCAPFPATTQPVHHPLYYRLPGTTHASARHEIGKRGLRLDYRVPGFTMTRIF